MCPGSIQCTFLFRRSNIVRWNSCCAQTWQVHVSEIVWHLFPCFQAYSRNHVKGPNIVSVESACSGFVDKVFATQLISSLNVWSSPAMSYNSGDLAEIEVGVVRVKCQKHDSEVDVQWSWLLVLQITSCRFQRQFMSISNRQKVEFI